MMAPVLYVPILFSSTGVCAQDVLLITVVHRRMRTGSKFRYCVVLVEKGMAAITITLSAIPSFRINTH